MSWSEMGIGRRAGTGQGLISDREERALRPAFLGCCATLGILNINRLCCLPASDLAYQSRDLGINEQARIASFGE